LAISLFLFHCEQLILIAVEVKKDDPLAVVCMRPYNVHEQVRTDVS
jgi:hypothetical protein